MQPDKIEFLL